MLIRTHYQNWPQNVGEAYAAAARSRIYPQPLPEWALTSGTPPGWGGTPAGVTDGEAGGWLQWGGYNAGGWLVVTHCFTSGFVIGPAIAYDYIMRRGMVPDAKQEA